MTNLGSHKGKLHKMISGMITPRINRSRRDGNARSLCCLMLGHDPWLTGLGRESSSQLDIFFFFSLLRDDDNLSFVSTGCFEESPLRVGFFLTKLASKLTRWIKLRKKLYSARRDAHASPDFLRLRKMPENACFFQEN